MWSYLPWMCVCSIMVNESESFVRIRRRREPLATWCHHLADLLLSQQLTTIPAIMVWPILFTSILSITFGLPQAQLAAAEADCQESHDLTASKSFQTICPDANNLAERINLHPFQTQGAALQSSASPNLTPTSPTVPLQASSRTYALGTSYRFATQSKPTNTHSPFGKCHHDCAQTNFFLCALASK